MPCPTLGRSAAGAHIHNKHALHSEPCRDRLFGRLDSQPRPRDFTRTNQLRHDAIDGVHGYGKADSGRSARRTVDRRVYADHLTVEIERRAARVAAVHGSVDLHIVIRTRADVTRERRDDTCRHRAAEAERVAYCHNPITDSRLLRRELDEREGLALGIDFEQGEISARIGANDVRLVLVLLVEGDSHLLGIVDHVVMHQRRHVDQLERNGDGFKPVQPIVPELARQQHQNGTNPFAARLQQMGRGFP